MKFYVNIINYLRKESSFLKSISLLASGSLIAQFVSIAAAPITTRLFTPSEFGKLTLILTLVNMFSPMLSFRYEQLIVMISDRREILTLIKLCIVLNSLLSIIVSSGYYFFYTYTGNEDALGISIVLFTMLLITGLLNIMVSVNNRFREYKLISSVSIIRTLAQQGLSILAGLLKLGASGLILSNVIGLFFGIGKQSKSLLKFGREIQKINYQDIKKIAKRYRRHPLFSVPSSLANSFSYSIVNFFIDSLFGTAILGYYSLSYRMLGLPLGLVSNNVSKVFYETAARDYEDKGEFNDSYKKTLMLVSSLAVPMVLILMTASESLFIVFFGSDWANAGRYVAILSPMYGIRLVASSLGVAIVLVQKQNLDFILQTLLLLTSVLSYFFAVYFKLSIEDFLKIICFLNSLIYLYWIFLIGYFSKKR